LLTLRLALLQKRVLWRRQWRLSAVSCVAGSLQIGQGVADHCVWRDQTQAAQAVAQAERAVVPQSPGCKRGGWVGRGQSR
jgi:hypothetical protein